MKNAIAVILGSLALAAFSALPPAPPGVNVADFNAVVGSIGAASSPPMRMLWQNPTTTDRSIWLMNGTSWDGTYVSLPQVAGAWSIAGSGDFNADGQADIVWQNTTTGNRLIWFMDSTSWGGTYSALPQTPVEWSIAGVGDFNADGQPDLVWENTVTGDHSIWFMNGATWDGSSFVMLPQETIAWKIGAVADFNADGKPDLVWQNISTGERSIWFMNGATWGGSYALLQTVVPEWRIAAAADFDGDGDPDLVWQNISTGERSVWLMNGSTWDGNAVLLPTVSTQWSIAGMLSAAQAPTGGDIVINVADVNPGNVSERDLCLTIAVGADAASECGDLRIVHELPSVRTLNKERTPVLVYNSAYGDPFPTVAANITLSGGNAGLDSVVAILKLNGVARAHSVYAGSAWPAAQASRIAIGFDASTETSGIYRYTLEVRAYNVSTSSARSVGADLVIVNREHSPLGGGWWLAGLDQLVLDPMGNPSVWVGGDGSVRRYNATGANWGAPTLDRPDTLKRDGSGYVRLLSGGVKVRFDSLGHHVATRNRLGYETTFAYDAGGRLNHLSVPLAPGNYQFHYATSGQLQTVDAPSNPGQSRTTTIYQSGVRVDSIKDPDSTRVRFAYLNTASGRITARTDRLGARTMYAFDSAQKVVSSNLLLSSSDSIYVAIRPKESLGLAASTGGAAVDTAIAYTRFDGARRDVADTTLFWLDRFGNPLRIRDATGAVTSVTRADSRFPALATQLVDAAGMVTLAQYDARGNPISVTTQNPFGDGRDAVATYQWDGVWDEVRSITLPEGEITTFQYDAVNGNRLSQQQGTDASRRVQFFYGNSYALPSSILVPGIAGRDSIEYDARGNPSATLTPSGYRTDYNTDAIGRDTLRLYPLDSAHTGWERITYDSADRIKVSTSFGPQMPKTPAYTLSPSQADSVVLTNRYDAEGNVLQVSRSRGVLYPGYAPISSYFEYDSAGRKISENLVGTVAKYIYDPAGNVVRSISARGDSVAMTYDRVNRLTRRIVPRTDYSSTSCVFFIQGGCFFSFPEREGPNLCIAADTSTLWYDSAGRMVRADNGSARIQRAYFRNGALKSDTLRTAKYARPCASMPASENFSAHIYGLNFTYDLDGRRKTLTHPAQFCAPYNCVESYAYDHNISALDTIVDIKGNTHSFMYDLAGRLSERVSPGGVLDEFTYDRESNLVAHSVHLPNASPYLADSSVFDKRGKMVSAHTESPQGTADISLSYSGLGAVTASEQQGSIGGFNSEEFIVDALGNRAARRQTSETFDQSDPERYRTLTYNQLSQLTRVDGPAQVPPNSFLYTETYDYDGAGNTTLFHKVTNGGGGGGLETFNDTKQLKRVAVTGAKRGVGPSAELDFSADAESVVEPNHHDSHMNYYGGDGKLRVFNRHIGVSDRSQDLTYGQRGTFDEYRYDALGRRVLTRTRRIGVSCPATLDCQSRAIRTVWDGDRVLYEIRAPGGEVVNDTVPPPPDSTLFTQRISFGPSAELDASINGSPAQPLPHADTIPDPGIEDDYNYVGYTHAIGVAGIDEPIAIHKGSETVIPHTGWRGMLAMGTYPNGAQSDCTVTYPCTRIDWPAANVTTDRGGYGRVEPSTWYGSLVSTGTEGSGLQYMRNRYYDPKRGQFTQADPFGIAGGLNLYGFAGGDPINFSDPFGLCPECEVLLVAAGGAALADSPLPGPGDVVAAGLVVGAGISYIGYQVSKSDAWNNAKKTVGRAIKIGLIGVLGWIGGAKTAGALTQADKARIEAEQRKEKQKEDQAVKERAKKKGAGSSGGPNDPPENPPLQ